MQSIESLLEELGQERRAAGNPDSLRGFINEQILCDIEDKAYECGPIWKAIEGGRLYVKHYHSENTRRYFLEYTDPWRLAEVSRERAAEAL